MKKFSDYLEKKVVAERMSSSHLNRMEGLANTNDLKAFMAAAKKVANSLYEEDFDEDEIAEFLAEYVKNNF